MNHKKPDISIILAVKNEEIYLNQALESILLQKGPSIEVVIVDDNSSDSTFKILEKFNSKFSNIKISKSLGVGKNAAFNLAYKMSSAEAICLFAGDDIMPKDSLRKRWEVFNIKKNKFVILSKMITLSSIPSMNGILIPKGKGKASTSGLSPLMPREISDKIFPVPEQLPNEDTWLDLHFRYNLKDSIFHSDTVCALWRIHELNSISHTQSFKVYSKKYDKRMRALGLFLEQFSDNLEAKEKKVLESQIHLENLRKNGKFISIIFLSVPLIEKLRAIANSNSFFYNLRKRLYNITSGWS